MITVDEYAAAFRQTLPDLNEKKLEMLRELLHAPEHTLSGEVLAKKLGYGHYVAANGLLGNIGKAIYGHVGRHPDGFAAGTFQPWTVIAQEGRNRAQGYPWQLRPTVVAALLGSGHFEAVRQPEELSESDSQTFTEGAVQIRYVNGFERSAAAREKCLTVYGYRCSCCDVDMANMYT